MSDFIETDKKTFFSTVGALNVHPRVEREATFWDLPSRECVGISEPGYTNAGLAPKTWRVARRLLSGKAPQ